MSKQIFKYPIPAEPLFGLLDKICMKEENTYIFNNNAYKKGIFDNNIPPFLEECKPYYHASKQKYVEKKMTYTAFTTVLRQICNFNDIKYTTKIRYEKSTYEIVYYICFTGDDKDLPDGSKDLSDGAKDLSDGAKDLSDGAKSETLDVLGA
jgi:X-X-X-Leu-X-X-Gly heptad repeat protein